jgi:hypothetical protein
MKPYVPEDDRFVPKCQAVHMASPKTSKAYLFGEIHTGVLPACGIEKSSSLTPAAIAKAHGIRVCKHDDYSDGVLWATIDDGKRGAKR